MKYTFLTNILLYSDNEYSCITANQVYLLKFLHLFLQLHDKPALEKNGNISITAKC